MKRTEFSSTELRERTDQELQGLERRLQEELFKLRMGRATNQLENVAKVKTTRRDLARVKTILQARSLGNEPAKPETREA